MSAYITYTRKNSNELECLPISCLSDYLLTVEEQQYLDTLESNTSSIISTLKLEAATLAGSTLYTQPYLNKLYARHDSQSYKDTDLTNLKRFMDSQMVGNDIEFFGKYMGTEQVK